jgi:hypothetical protein
MNQRRFFVMLAATACLAPPLFSAEAEQRVIAETPVRIVTSSDPAIFPESWRGAKVAASGEALPEEQFERVRRILDRALKKYPPRILETHLRAIYALSELRYSGVITAGTNSRTSVYLKFGDEQKRYTDAVIEGVFHAEFSSILLRNCADDFDQAAWKAANPPGFTYLGHGVEAVKQRKAGLVRTEGLHAQGFLVEYGQSTLENDLNGMAAALFQGDAALWQIADRFPRIQRKLDLAVAFYHAIDPAFTEASFRSLCR